ncbi:hypothetical protein I79_017515 [Cricetulus griseus]|uniref:Uncharacterized protein n=1 Tax=Cricetulus griseus TaxID=10029 RepID=G3I286_CRIGR|nr:hypothetical protein I79_017515 [Cricetulus griseus]
MLMLGIKHGNPTAEALVRQIPNSQMCHYTIEGEDGPLLFLFYYLEVKKFPTCSLKDCMISIPL